MPFSIWLFKVSFSSIKSLVSSISPPNSVVATIEVAPSDTEVVSPRTAVFYCEVFGVFIPNITWQMNGNILESGGDIDIEIETKGDMRNSTLSIQNTVPSDAGNYTCLAENDAGSDFASAQLTVNCMPIVDSI